MRTANYTDACASVTTRQHLASLPLSAHRAPIRVPAIAAGAPVVVRAPVLSVQLSAASGGT